MAKAGQIKCRWCGEFFDEGDVSIELNMGPLCDNCVAELESRGEHPVIVHGMSYEEWLAEKKERTKRKGE
jgi:hypothetical protein